VSQRIFALRREEQEMYSLVLMAALSAGGDLPACNRGGCCGWGGYYGCYGGWGGYGCYGYWGGWNGGYGCYGYLGGYGGWGGHSASVGPGTAYAAFPQLAAPVSQHTARLIVELPASAKLYVDDQPMTGTSARRVFQTPTLEPGRSYHYMLRAELVSGGKTYQETKKITLRSGEEIRASFPNLDEVQTAEFSQR
jgi:uncharacterized protein (TIGR03000 family)